MIFTLYESIYVCIVLKIIFLEQNDLFFIILKRILKAVGKATNFMFFENINLFIILIFWSQCLSKNITVGSSSLFCTTNSRVW